MMANRRPCFVPCTLVSLLAAVNSSAQSHLGVVPPVAGSVVPGPPAPSELWSRRQALFEDYDAALPPPNMRHGEPLLVKFGLVVKKVYFNIHSSTLHLDVWLRMKWFDERLMYDPVTMFGPDYEAHDYLPISMMTGDDTNLWVPDLHCTNATDSLDGIMMSYANIHHSASPGIVNDTDGVPWNVFLSRPGSISVHCTPALENFPFDTPTCAMDFQSWGFSEGYLRIVNMSEGWQLGADMPLSMDYRFADDGAFTWDERPQDEANFDACDLHFSNYRVTMRLMRLPAYHITHSVAPLTMVVFLSALTFWLPINNDSSGSGERLSYAVMLVLTIITVMLFTSSKKPAVPETTWMDRWQTRSLLLSILPVIETATIFWFRNIVQLNDDMRKQPMQHRFKSFSMKDKQKSMNHRVASLLDNAKRKYDAWMPQGALKFFGPIGPENIDTWFRIVFPFIIIATYQFLPLRILNMVRESGRFVHGTPLISGIFLFVLILCMPSVYLLVSRICSACSADCCRRGRNVDGGYGSSSDAYSD